MHQETNIQTCKMDKTYNCNNNNHNKDLIKNN